MIQASQSLGDTVKYIKRDDYIATPSDLTDAYWQFRYPAYIRQNLRVQEHLASLKLPLHKRSVLEVGAGIGDHTSFFLDRDCTVVSVEPRAVNCQVFQSLYANYGKSENLTLVQTDAERIGTAITEVFEVVYCYGLLYHVADPKNILNLLAEKCSDLFLLETCVSFGDHEAINPVAEPDAPSQAFHGAGCRPTRPFIFSALKELFPYVYIPKTQPSFELFPIDWTLSASPVSPKTLSRAVFIASRNVLANELLVDHLTDHQERQ